MLDTDAWMVISTIDTLVGRGPTLGAHVGLGTTAMSGFVPPIFSFRVWLSILEVRSHFCMPLALTDLACSFIKLACLLLI